MRRSRQPKGGFTLLETLVAFMVFAAFVILVHKSFWTGMRGQETSELSDKTISAVMSEFALIEAGLAQDGGAYEKPIGNGKLLSVRQSLLESSQIGIRIPKALLLNVAIQVVDEDSGKGPMFSKIIQRN